MKKGNGLVYLFGIVLVIFLASFVSATYNFSNHSIQSSYSKDSSISGSIKISFTNEPINSLFTDSLGNSIELRDLLFSSQSYSYTCAYTSCESKFASVASGTSFPFSLPNEESAFYGLVFDVNLEKINSASFELVSDASESSENQISIDFFNDDEIDIKNTKVGSSFGDENFGCFNSTQTTTELTITSTPYCQNISLYESPGLKMGAWVKKIVSGPNTISMKLYKEDGTFVNGCALTTISSIGTEVFCNIDSPIEDKNYFVCINSVGSGGDYKIRGFSQLNNCGFQGVPPKNPVYTYQIGVSERNFGNVGTLQISNTLPNGNNLSTMIENYIVSKYGGKDCSTETCFVPIKITSSKNQSITLRNLNVNYDFQGGSGVAMTSIHKFEEDPSNVNASMGSLPLGSFFKLPNQEQNITYGFNYKGNYLFQKSISIKDYGIGVYPLKSAAGFPTNFKAIVPPGLNISSYNWDFGDSISTTTSIPSVKHTYQEKGNFTLVLKASTSVGEILTNFKIEVESPKEILDKEIKESKTRIHEFEEKLILLDSFEKIEVEKFVNVSFLKTELEIIEFDYSLATNDEEYAQIVSRLLNLSFPLSLEKIDSGQIFFIPTEESIDLDVLSSITGKTYNNSQSTYDYIRFWNVNKLDSDVSEKSLVIVWMEKPPSYIRFFELSVSPSKTIDEDYYFIIKNVEGLSLEKEGQFEEVGGYNYIKLMSQNNKFRFSTTETGPISNLMFISPSIIDIGEIGEIEESKKDILIIILGIVGVLLIGLFVYFILHRWYKVKYERYLFPDKNHLYNAIFYINNSVKSGMEEYEIRKNLLSAGWKGEQVSYLMKKYAGKPTGMVDIFGFMKDKPQNSPKQVPPKPGFNSEYQERGKNTRFNK